MAEFITRANYGLISGNFEMDFGDGEVRYKTCVDIEGDRFTPAVIKNAVLTNVSAMDQYLPGLISVMYGGASPAQAIEKLEG